MPAALPAALGVNVTEPPAGALNVPPTAVNAVKLAAFKPSSGSVAKVEGTIGIIMSVLARGRYRRIVTYW